MKRKPYDYIRQLFSEYGQRTDVVFAHPNNAKRVLRRLVRQAVMEASKDITFFPRDATRVADRIAKELVP